MEASKLSQDIHNLHKKLDFAMRRPAFLQTEAVRDFLQKVEQGCFTLTEVKCLCGAQSDVRIASYDRYGIPLTTVLCINCGLMRSNPYYNEASLLRFYRDYYRNIYTGWQGDKAVEYIFEHEYKVGEHVHSLLRECNLPVPRLIYDIGCGAGGTLSYFVEQGAHAVGCDFDERYISYGLARGLDTRLGSTESLPNEKADLIILNHCLEHMLNPIDFLKQVQNYLSDSGVMFVSVPGIFSIHETYGDISLFLQNAHVWHFCLATLDFVVSKAGYKKVWGNEDISALYVRGGEPLVDTGTAEEVLRYLFWVERRGRILRYKQWALRYLKYYGRNSLGGIPYKLYRFVKGWRPRNE